LRFAFFSQKGRPGIDLAQFDIDAELREAGLPLELQDWPLQEELLETDEGASRLAGYLVGRQDG
jgi:hypothetical protein